MRAATTHLSARHNLDCSFDAILLRRPGQPQASPSRRALGTRAHLSPAGDPLAPHGAAIWVGLSPQATLHYTAARPGPEGGPRGGVAILRPATWEVTNSIVLVDACALQVAARARAGAAPLVRSHSLYLPPDSLAPAADAYPLVPWPHHGLPFCSRQGTSMSSSALLA